MNQEVSNILFDYIKNNKYVEFITFLSKNDIKNTNSVIKLDDIKNEYGINIVEYTALNNNIPILNELVKLGLDINKTNANGETIAFIATKNNNKKMLQFLKINNVSLVKVNKDGNNLIHYNLLNTPNDDIIIYLLEENIDLNQQNNDGFTPLNIIQNVLKLEDNKYKKTLLSIETRIRYKMYNNKYQDKCFNNDLYNIVNEDYSFIKSNDIDIYKDRNNKHKSNIIVSNCDTIEEEEEAIEEEAIEESVVILTEQDEQLNEEEENLNKSNFKNIEGFITSTSNGDNNIIFVIILIIMLILVIIKYVYINKFNKSN
jgi:ankyrin repeat protein